MKKIMYKTKNTNRNKDLVNVIKSRLVDLKNEVKKMSEDETEIEKPDEMVDIVEKILELNDQNQEGKGLKILTPDQTLSGLPISLAQLKVGNDSEKLKNEVIQLLYSLYRSKKLSKRIYNNLINTIWKRKQSLWTLKIVRQMTLTNFFYEFSDRINLKEPNQNIELANLSIYYMWKNIKSAYKNNGFKISTPTWNDEFDLPEGSYSI